MAFPFLAIFLAFVIFLAIRYKSTDAKVQKMQDDFWEREAQANITPQINLDNLTYITIPLDKFPLGFSDEPAILEMENKLRELSTHRMLNLTGKTNTELKETYGVGNLDTVASYGDDYDKLTVLLKDYATALINADMIDEAVAVLEYGVGIKTDVSQNYILLGDCYKSLGKISKIGYLKDQVESLNLVLGTSIINHLNELLDDPDAVVEHFSTESK
ncbi:MAG: hypothetical protein E7281_00685 [Lachnospiraceae bacterium]|nr:hypothetical protein [Lachnospiraceae bacterium]